ncbi:type II toxin-antitoxin system HipA family toxin [Vibrio alginolyticus]|uniref:type II toxin-antitoxin system HipA family toxin n=1 Tax=Vibrio alginolyticus TaxID=663 RepID=UPI0006CA87DB|nr:HipA domain-containing protein [Vibrio alginolyticus]KPM98428.1 phosphatidylinositol kinase [Vibrio alginolyticus]CAH7136240.1 Phosphatidylinositol kinase [Vibrio chagasii]
MTSNNSCFVWKWLKGETEPVVAGKIVMDGEQMVFVYGSSYLARDNREAIYSEELPLNGETHSASDLSLKNFSCIRDAAPDAWGRRVIHSKLDRNLDDFLDEMTYMMNSSSDRIGSIDFQESNIEYIPRGEEQASLDELESAATIISEGRPLPLDLDKALLHGTSLGGARPKAMIYDDEHKFIAKFSAQTDTYDIVKSEYVAMRLAKLCGLNVAEVKLVHTNGKDALLVERFDREKHSNGGWLRNSMVSALTVLGLDEGIAHYSTYPELVDKMQLLCADFKQDARELFERIVFNVMVGNTDDHARNHAFFVDGDQLTLTPAYDICPQARTGGEASHGMTIHEGSNKSLIQNCLRAAPTFKVSETDAVDIIKNQIATINREFKAVCDEVGLPYQTRKILWRSAMLNDYIFNHTGDEYKNIVTYELEQNT